VFEGQLALDQGDGAQAARRAYGAMLQAARTLVRMQDQDIGEDPERIVAEFRTRLHETKLFSDPYAGDKFAHYLLRAHARAGDGVTLEGAHQRLEEATLFIEAAHACYDRMTALPAAPAR
jgi:sulfite reductase (ferredoxin)